MRRLLLALAAVLVPTLVVAQDGGCAPATEVLSWTSQIVADVALQDGPATEAHARLLLEATNKADAAATAAGWPESYNAVLAELGYLAATIADNGGVAEAAETNAIADYGSNLAGTAAIRCGIDVVPSMPMTLVGDPSACPRVIDGLTRLKEVLPAIRRGGGGFSGALILAASITLLDAVHAATNAGWDRDTLTLLTKISDDVGAIADGQLRPDAALAATLVGVGVGVELQARAICIGQDVPRLAAAS